MRTVPFLWVLALPFLFASTAFSAGPVTLTNTGFEISEGWAGFIDKSGGPGAGNEIVNHADALGNLWDSPTGGGNTQQATIWRRSSSPFGNNGSDSVAVFNVNTPQTGQQSELRVDPPGTDGVTQLSFFAGKFSGSSNNYTINVEWSVDGTNWNPITTFTNLDFPGTSSFTPFGPFNVNATGDVKVRWVCIGNKGMILDDVVITYEASLPVVNSFVASPGNINANDPVTLSWDVSDFTALSIDNGVGDVTSLTEITLNPGPAVTTTYTLTATNATGSVNTEVGVYVGVTPLPPVLNEFLAINDNGLQDEDGVESDWLEIYNPNPFYFNVGGYYLTDDSLNLVKWQIPDYNMAPGEYLVIFASNKDRRVPGSEFHTNFRLSGGGEYLAIVDPDQTTVVDEHNPSFPIQLSNITYGRTGGSTTYLATPTPGAFNSGPANIGPSIEGVTEQIVLQPTNNDDIVVTCSVTQFFLPVDFSSIDLHYRVMYGSDSTVSMNDNGTGGDATASDGIYSATIPASASLPAEMVRWYVTAQDTSGNNSRNPRIQAGDQAAEYYGTVIADPIINHQIPDFQYFVEDTSWFIESGTGCYTKEYTSCSVYYKGEFYDNLRVRLRGASSVLRKFPVQSLYFNFNSEHRFLLSENIPVMDCVALNSMFVDEAYIRNHLSMQIFAAAGSPASLTDMWVVYENGSFRNVGNFIEHPDDRYLKRNGLDENGALYKIYNRLANANPRPAWTPCVSPNSLVGVEKKTRLFEDNSDLQAFIDGIANGNPNREIFLFDNLDIPIVLDYMAASVLDQGRDVFAKNTFMHRDTDGSGEWMILPWDRDVSWGWRRWRNSGELITYNDSKSHPYFGSTPGGNEEYPVFDAVIETPVLREMFRRRLRSVMDEFLQPPGTPAGQLLLETALDNLLAQMSTEVNQEKALHGDLEPPTQSMAVAIAAIKNDYLAGRRTYLYNTHGASGTGIVPNAQAANPTINFGALEFNPPSGNQDEEYIELINPNADAVDISGWKLTGGVQHTFKKGTVIAAGRNLFASPKVQVFRARSVSPKSGEGLFVQGNYSGHLSSFGETIILTTENDVEIDRITYTGNPSDPQRYLRVTEINYHPTDPDFNEINDGVLEKNEFEFIELCNVSTTATLDLSGIKFTAGILFEFDLGSVTSLAPGEIVLVVRNKSSFEARYGISFSSKIAGEYSPDNLNNDGEKLKIEDNTNSTIQDFTYNDGIGWPQQADGLGSTLLVIDVNGDYDSPFNWKDSVNINGTPGKHGDDILQPPDEQPSNVEILWHLLGEGA